MPLTRRQIPGYHKRLSAARHRRRMLARPFLWDNAVLAEGADGPNRFDPVRPRRPGAKTAAARVLLAIAARPRTASQLAAALGLDESQVRSAINALRTPRGWPIENDGEGRFCLDTSHSLAAQALQTMKQAPPAE
jgi:biotin operon repressor